MHTPARKHPTRARQETSYLVLGLQPESPRKSTLRRIKTFAKSMGAHILCTTQRIVINLRKMDQRKPISMPPRKVERNPILLSSLLPN
jgi:hypothetical protein